ncbi:hypothetical protein [Microbacterium sp. SORGH_AS_0862]|uniref:hypothetical protein n=1 Tax=Microbacterium sp. SORGH_AS_0862 TaxID=3041789 RepID=UPI00278F4CDE|nr:hypothetical protein [Microbacterium sp. SORGH_AS_0862]MDQ1204593.1 hypothetical protein [Microbacterium sp. SORGH_AS_0862]
MKALKPLVLVAAALALTGCSQAATDTAEPAGSSAAADADSGSAPAPQAGSGTGDACTLVPSPDIAAALGVDAVDGVASEGQQGLQQCTWTYADTHTAIAQYTTDADAFLPAELYPQGADAQPVPGITRGWADASIGTILVVKGDAGILLVDIDPGGSGADPVLWTALGETIASRF